MHETAIMGRIVGIAVRHAKSNGCTKVSKLVVQVGQLSGVVPESLQFCFPMFCEETILDGAVLEIEAVPARGVCRECSNEYNLVLAEFQCPCCKSDKWEIISGKELLLKEIEAV